MRRSRACRDRCRPLAPGEYTGVSGNVSVIENLGYARSWGKIADRGDAGGAIGIIGPIGCPEWSGVARQQRRGPNDSLVHSQGRTIGIIHPRGHGNGTISLATNHYPLSTRPPLPMRLISYSSPTGPRVAGVTNGGFVDLNGADNRVPCCIKELLGQGPEGLRCAAEALGRGEPIPPGEIEPLPIVPHPEKIICVGKNYADHVHETVRNCPPSRSSSASFPRPFADISRRSGCRRQATKSIMKPSWWR